MITYQFVVRTPTREFVRTAATIEDELNRHMEAFGFHEKMAFCTDIEVNMTCEKEPTEAQLTLMKGLIGTEFEKRFPGSKVVKVTRMDRVPVGVMSVNKQNE